MKNVLVALVVFAAVSSCAAEPQLPVHSGEYSFQRRSAEHSAMPGVAVMAKIQGRHIAVIYEGTSEALPRGVIAEGTLMWHQKSRQWIIGTHESDRNAPEVGGCTSGPEVVDLKRGVYWTC